MRSRTFREGSVGLLILLGLLLFGGLIFWLRGLGIGQRSYKFMVQFANANGMREGAVVRYRGFEVGRIIAIQPDSNGVSVEIEISSPNLRMPKDIIIEANQSGLIGETTIDIRPKEDVELSSEAKSLSPSSDNCNPNLLVCGEDQLQGYVGVSFESLLRSTDRFSKLYTNPVFFQNINATAQNAGIAAAEIAALSKELALLSSTVRKELKGFSEVATSVTNATNQTSVQIVKTSEKYGEVATELSQLASNVNSLISENQGNLVNTLNSISDTSDKLRILLVGLEPTLDQVNSTLTSNNTEQLVQNLETLTANAAEASGNLREISSTLNNPTNLVVLQQTLDSARVTFENAQKITSDLDELTGNPTFRNNLLNLVNGLSSLVSSTEQLEEQIETAQVLETINTANTAKDKSKSNNNEVKDQEQNTILELAPTVPNSQSNPSGSPIAKKSIDLLPKSEIGN